MRAVDYGPLRPEEAEALAALAGLIWRHDYPGMISAEQIEYMLAQRYHPPLIRQTLARGDRWDAAHADGALIGFAHAYAISGGGMKLDKLYVHPDWQRRGIGARLLARLEAYARAHGRHALLLRVNRGNARAIAAYRKYGFAVEREVEEEIGGGFVMDDYMMIKQLAGT
ncbi:MAG: GNAT family N-acetyltransferase [Thiobacillaceae bacterium]|jgi:ribosomal protein S18 acetylase RimI-like enzyme|nr:GNAT family N-acetyltransferase [Thiobacillaceae bacterium]